MNQRLLPLIIGSLLLPLGCSVTDPDTSLILQPSELCSDHADSAIATFEDANLKVAIRDALRVGTQDDLLTCGRISALTNLTADDAGITSLVGIQNLTSLRDLDLSRNFSITDISLLSGLTSLTGLSLGSDSISDISALSELPSLRVLDLGNNRITDISALSGLTSLALLPLGGSSITDISALSGLRSLVFLGLSANPDLTDIQPLLDNTGLGTGAQVDLGFTNVSCTDVALLEAKGVEVDADCP